VSNYSTYLMLEMSKDINEVWENNSDRAHEFCLLLSLTGQPVPETFFKMYLANVDCNQETLYNAVAFFTGLGFLKIECDCENHDKLLCDLNYTEDSSFFKIGEDFFQSKDKVWSSLRSRIDSLQHELQL